MSQELPPEVAWLLVAERAVEDPPDAARARVEARLDATLGLVVGAAAVAGAAAGVVAGNTANAAAITATATTATTTSATTATGNIGAVKTALGWKAIAAHFVATKIVIVAVAAGGVIGTGYLVKRTVDQRRTREAAKDPTREGLATPSSALRAPSPPSLAPGNPSAAPLMMGDGSEPRAATAPATGEPHAMSIGVTRAAGLAAPRTRSPARGGGGLRASAAGTKSAASEDSSDASQRPASIAAERDLLAMAREALLARDFAAATRALDRHARLFADGQLAEERDSLRVRVAVAAGDTDAARALADAFARAHPGSLFLPAVRAAVAE